MPYITSAILGVGLAMDAFAASVSGGMSNVGGKIKHALITALSYGLFQAVMTFIGYCTGSYFSKYIAAFDHWVAFILLTYIGVRTIVSSVRDKDKSNVYIFSFKLLLITSIATIIDALAAGVSLALGEANESENFIISCLIIGVITFVLSFVGFMLGKYTGKFLKKKVEIAGGVILILIGVKVLVEHLFF